MENSYHLTVAGCARDLPICKVNENLDIAAFIMFGDIELTAKTASALLSICPEHDVLITAEAKGIPLCYEMARQEGKDYVVARKSTKLYMKSPIDIEVRSITTDYKQRLYLGQTECSALEGKRVLIVDDVVSTGASLFAVEQLVQKARGNIVGKACVLAEGEAQNRKDIIFLECLPLFMKKRYE